MDLGGNGGFHGYRSRLPHPTSEMKVAVEMNMGVSASPGQLKVFNNPVGSEEGECTVREQDRFMPIANVIRIMRKILPPHAKISDDAKETIQECVSEYISFITGEANERCQREQRKTITAEDVLWAMSKLGFDDYIEPLTLYLHRYREYDGGERGSLRGDPLLKRTMLDPAASFPPPFVPPFPVGHHHAYFGFPPMNGGYLQRDESNAGSSHPANIDPYPQCKE